MNPELSNFAARLRGMIPPAVLPPEPCPGEAMHGCGSSLADFEALALELFSLQFAHNPLYRRTCEARGLEPGSVAHWTQIPAVPAASFKELEWTAIPPGERTAVFHSSGTTVQRPGRHFHCPESLALYEAALWAWFRESFRSPLAGFQPVVLAPPPERAPHSSLVHMFATICARLGEGGAPGDRPAFVGGLAADGTWTLDFEAMLERLRAGIAADRPLLVLGTAFSFVHQADHLAERGIGLALPPGSRVMETGGYKNRSRSMPKAELHALIARRLGVPREAILCEYGMSELGSQAYDSAGAPGVFRFPPWARARILSPETGLEAADGAAGLIRVVDLANVFSVAAVQTEDLGIRRGDGFELAGRAPLAEPRGCSLMTA